MDQVFWGNYGIGLAYQIEGFYYSALMIFLYVTAGLIAWKWPQFSLLKNRWVQITAGLVFFIFSIFTCQLGHDEAEHIHASWLMSQGMLPFRDFWEHHSPALWIMMAPLYKIVPAGVLAMDATRLVMALLALATLWALIAGARLMKLSPVWNYWLVFFWLLAIPLGRTWELRPDPFGNLFALLALGSLCYGSGLKPAGISGLLIGLTLAISPKHLIICAIPAFILLTGKQPLRALLVHVLGIMIGLLPLFIWLQANDLGGEFVEWVGLFNSLHKGKSFGILLPLVSCIVIVGWCASRPSFTWKGLTLPERLLLLTALASMATTFFQPLQGAKFQYNLQMLFAIQPLFAAAAISWWLKLIPAQQWRAVFIALLGVLSLAPILRDYAVEIRIGYNYFNSRQIVQNLNHIAGDEPVLGIVPYHPLFKYDVANLFLRYELEHIGNPVLKINHLNLIQDIKTKKPSLIFYGGSELEFIELLRGGGLLDLQGELDLLEFLHANYELYKPFRSAGFWVRNDRMEAVKKLKLN